MASREWLVEHRELQYLRAAEACAPRRSGRASNLASRRSYARDRWRKLQDARRWANGR